MTLIRLLWYLLSGIWLFFCISPLSAQVDLAVDEIEWEAGDVLQIGRFELQQPRPMRGVVAKIDLEQDIRFVVTPSNGDRAKETIGLRTSSFLKQFRCDLAINAGPFQPVRLFENGDHDVLGLQVSDGHLVSPIEGDRPGFFVYKNGTAQIRYKAPDPDRLAHAVSGFQIVLWKGEVKGKDVPLHPRTAAALSQDGRWLYLLVIDGRQPNVSEGASMQDLGQMLKSLGAHDGINLDGGGSTTIVRAGPDGEPIVLNTPINNGFRGSERPVGSHLGIILGSAK